MNDRRLVVTDKVWVRLAPHLPGKQGDAGAAGKDNRLFLEAVLSRVRTGLPWRDLPADFGNWNSVFRRFRRWAEGGVFERIFKEITGTPDFEYAMIDGMIVQDHQKASGARGVSGSSHWALARRIDHQDRCFGRRARKSGQLRSPARPNARHEGRRTGHRWRCLRFSLGRHGFSQNLMRAEPPPSSHRKRTASSCAITINTPTYGGI